MSDSGLDEIDYTILRAIQEDARHNTNAAISERLAVTASTVSKRLGRLESDGIIKGYSSDIDYEQAGFPLNVLFICTAPIAERTQLIEQALSIEGVVNVRELMTGKRNVHIQVVGASKNDITHSAYLLDNMGYTVSDEILLRTEYRQPSSRFHSESEN
jgi:DNA-binding Lrp family transcriptional regulator